MKFIFGQRQPLSTPVSGLFGSRDEGTAPHPCATEVIIHFGSADEKRQHGVEAQFLIFVSHPELQQA